MEEQKATYSCPLWDEQNILYDDYSDDESNYYDDDDDYDYVKILMITISGLHQYHP